MPCPTPERLRELLDEQLPADLVDEFSSHIESCKSCQLQLDSLTDLAGTQLKPLDSTHHDWTPDETLIDRFRGLHSSAVSSTTPATLPKIPGYRVIQSVGSGGMGVVYEAEQLQPRRKVAIKLLHVTSSLQSESRSRLLKEADAIARVRHRHIVEIFEVGTVEDRPFLSLEYVDNGNLATQISGEPQPAAAAAELVAQLAEAIEHAHHNGIIHRDLKPANVLIDDDGSPKITDFGLAKFVGDSGPTRTGEVLGSPSYMAPEQAGQPGEISTQTDVYALGAILYEMLTGRPPFQAESPLETMIQVRHQEVVAPRALRGNLPRDLQTICLKCLQKSPRERYASALELADDLRRFLKDEPIHARRPSVVARTWKWVRRKPMRAAAMASVAVILALTAILFFNFSSSRLESRERISAALDEAELMIGFSQWDQAQLALDRGDAEAKRGYATVPQQQELTDLAAEVRMVQRLEDVLLEFTRVDPNRSIFLNKEAEPYELAFADFGIQAGVTDVNEAVDRLDSLHPETKEVCLAAINDWLGSATDEPYHPWLGELVGAIQSDSWQKELDKLIAEGDAEAIEAFVESYLEEERTSLDLRMLADRLAHSKRQNLGLTVLYHAQRIYPDSFWVNSELASLLWSGHPVDHEDVVRFCAIAVSIRPDNEGALVNLGTALFDKGEYVEAEQIFRRAIAIAPTYLTARLNLGQAIKAQGRFEEALDSFREILRDHPESAECQHSIGNTLMMLDRPEEARVYLNDALEIRPKHYKSLRDLAWVEKQAGNTRAQIRLLNEAHSLAPGNEEVLTNLAVAYFHDGQYDEAAPRFLQALKLDPDNGRNRGLYAVTLIDAGQPVEAESQLRRAVSSRISDPQAFGNLAYLLAQRGDLAEAISIMEQGIQRFPANFMLLQRLASYHNENRNPKQAKHYYEKCLELQPENVNVLTMYGAILNNYFDRPEEALQQFDKALSIDDSHVTAWFNRGMVLRYTDNYVESARSFRKAVENGHPNPCAVWAEVASSLEAGGRPPAEVIEAAAESLKLGDDPRAQRAMAISLHRMDRLAEALPRFVASVDAYGGDIKQRYHGVSCVCKLLRAADEGEPLPEGTTRDELHGYAHQWLTDLQKMWAEIARGQPQRRSEAASVMVGFATDPDYAELNDESHVAEMEPARREAFEQLWESYQLSAQQWSGSGD